MSSGSLDGGRNPPDYSVEVDWVDLAALPFDEWERTAHIPALNVWVQRASRMTWNVDDEHFSQPQYTTAIMRLLRIITVEVRRNLENFHREKEELERFASAARDAEEAIRARVELLRRENKELHTLMEQKGIAQDVAEEKAFSHGLNPGAEKRRIKERLEKSARELDRLKHENNELRRTVQRCNAEKRSMETEHGKFRLEYEHLAAKHKRLIEKFKKSDEMLREFQCSETAKGRDEESELHQLRQKVRILQEENYNLVQSRDRAEELCEKREAEALRDMSELQQLHRDIVEEEKQRSQALAMELQNLQHDSQCRMEKAVQELQQSIKQLEDENSALRKRLERRFGVGHPSERDTTENSESAGRNSLSVSASMSSFFPAASPRSKFESDIRTRQGLTADRQPLQQENDRLAAELQQMEIRAESRDAEIIKLQRILKEYERGDEGLHRLRGELADSNRSIELLQDENAQLRERLNAMEDSLTFSAALQELCIRMGVTQEEIDRLHPSNTPLFSELETLREEVATLKDEVEWLEKERRHWMDKVRLQPLLDTKLRLELGLSPEQLRQLDHMVDQMKSGRIIVEEDSEENYKEKYFHELQLRRKEMEHFNNFVRHRIEEVLREALGKTDLKSAPDATSALHALRERLDLITARPIMDLTAEPPLDAAQLRMQLKSAAQLLEQSELTIKDNAASQAVLREQLAAVTAERDMLMGERDQYRTAVFEALGSTMYSLPTAERHELNAEKVAASSVAATVSGVASDAISSPALPGAQKENLTALRSASFVSFSRTFEEQLRVKDELIASLKGAIEAAKHEMAQHRASEAKATERLSEACAVQEDLRNQVSAIQQMNEELNGKLEERNKIVEDLQDAMQRLEPDSTHQLLQKIVVLRQREGKLLERLRRVRETQEEARSSEQTMREYVNTTFKSLKEALDDTSTGFVLPRSSSAICVEKDILEDIQQRLEGELQGKLFKEDSVYVLQLCEVYRNMEHMEELSSLRLRERQKRKQIEGMEIEMDEMRAELECLRKAREGTSHTHGDDASQAARWETEATTWRQKCGLYMRRCEDREREVSTLEAELGDAREELALLHEHLHNTSCGNRNDSTTCATQTVGVLRQEPPEEGSTPSPQQGQLQIQHQPEPKRGTHGNAADNKVRQLERDVARLKSINLGLLHHSLDLQGEYKRLEIQLEATKQELSLVRDAGDSRKISEFVSAAIQQHAALRRQSELALLRAKRVRVQLCASEANLRVAVNEATSYRLSAFRLYRTYVSQMVSVLDYVRSLHRGIKGAMSPHRVEMMHKRFLDAIADVEHSQTRQNEMAAKLSESDGMVGLLRQQLDLLKAKDTEDLDNALYTKLLASLSAVREKDMRLAELQEDHQYMQQKLKRADSHIQQLTEELTRLELRASGGISLNEDILQRLLQLKESVFAKVESPALIMQSNGGGPRDMDDGGADAAIYEYKMALDKQAELARECGSLRKRLESEVAEGQKARAETETLREEMEHLRGRLQYAQRQLEEERQKGEERERRIVRSHEAQAEVTRRAAEHNSQCLRDMLQNKEACIKQLQEQLQVERRKYLEYQLQESSRMERLHDHLFKENNAMMERFREAIDGVTENYTYNTVAQGTALSDASPDGAAAQLALLTKETLLLKAELKDARMTNIMLEAQLNDQVAKAQNQLLLQQGPNQGTQQVPQQVPLGEDSVVGVIKDQNAIIESLRQREFALTREVQRYRDERDSMERQLHEVRHLVVEQGGVLKSVAAVGMTDSSVEQELRAQLAFVESQLVETRAQLEEERQSACRLQADTSEWRSHLDALREEVVRQQADVERARHLVTMNEGLNADVRRMEEQNEKLILATKMLKEKLIEKAQQHGDASRKQQHEIALAQRMGSIQLESTEQLKSVNERLHSIQRELEQKVRREEEALKKHEEAQRMAYDLHRQLQEREQEILRLKRELAGTRSASLHAVRSGREKGTQVLHTVQEEKQKLCETAEAAPRKPLKVEGEEKREDEKVQKPPTHRSPSSSPAPTRVLLADTDTNVLAKPQIAAMLRREIEKAQRNNMHDISSLRADVRRLENDLEEARQQLRGERDTSRSLRVMVQNARRELEEKELALARASVSQQQRAKEHQHVEGVFATAASEPPATVTTPAINTAVSGEQDQLRRQREENEQLRRQIDRLKKRVVTFDSVVSEAESYKKELTDLRCQRVESVDAAHMASPLDIRSHKRTVLHLEGVIDSLRRELSVNKEMQVRALQRRIDELTAELSSRHQATPILEPPTAPSRADHGSERATLERELLEKNGIILDLRFEREALQLKVGRLERHIEDILQVDSTNTKRVGTSQQRSRVEALESVVENLKLVVEHLQKENSVLKTKTVSISKHMDLVRELRELRQSERKLREHSEMLAKRLLCSAPSGSAMSRQHATLQRRLQTAQATMEQYQAEMLELKQKLDERQHTGESEDMMLSGQRYQEESPEWEDRRVVQPIETWSSELPPPLPNPPVILTARSPPGHPTYPHAEDPSVSGAS